MNTPKQTRYLPHAESAQKSTPLIPKAIEQPAVYFTNAVLQAINYIVMNSDKEVAWLGRVEQLDDGNYLVSDLYLPKQTVTGASVDIDPDALANLALEIMDAGHDPDTLRYHGHSHVDMGVTPSQTDQNHMMEYLEGVDWFIRSIHNRKGNLRVDVFDKANNLIHHCVDTDNYDTLMDGDFYDRLDQLLDNQVTTKIYKHPAQTTRRGLALPRLLHEAPYPPRDFHTPAPKHPSTYDFDFEDDSDDEVYYSQSELDLLHDPFGYKE